MELNKLILLCGFSRSGTTWLSKILDSFTSTYLISEPDKRINRHLKFGNVPHCINEENEKFRQIYKKSLSELIERFDCNLRSFPYFRKDYLAVPYSVYWNLSCFSQFITYVKNRCNMKGVALPSFCFKNNCSVDLIWKSVNQSSNIPFIQKTFPEIKIVYLLRNPYATIASMLRNNKMSLDGQDFRRINERKESLFFRCNEIDLRKIYNKKEIEKKALLWRIECESAVMAGENNDNFLLVTYEDLVRNTIYKINSISEFLDLKISKETQDFLAQSTGRQKPPVISRLFSSGYFGVYRKPGLNMDKWKKTISEDDYKLIKTVLEGSTLLQYWKDRP